MLNSQHTDTYNIYPRLWTPFAEFDFHFSPVTKCDDLNSLTLIFIAYRACDQLISPCYTFSHSEIALNSHPPH